MSKVAIITGGASGMGLAVATSLASKGGWDITILDLNTEAGAAAASSLKATTFIRTDVNDYTTLVSAFHQTFQSHHRLDFVFANAGIVEKHNSFYTASSDDKTAPPPPPNMLTIDVDLKSVISTTYLAQHYFRLNLPSPKGKIGNLIMTSSVGGLYALPQFPIYCAAKHGVVGLMRSIAGPFFKNDGIRVNAICPGTVRTNLLPKESWDAMKTTFVPIEKVVEAVEMLLDEEKGLVGKTVELSGEKWYFREQIEYMDEDMRETLEGPRSGSEK